MSQVPVWAGDASAAGLKVKDRDRFKAYLASIDGPAEIIVRRWKSQRSLDQNAYVWGVAYPVIAEALGYDKHEHEELHYALVAKCFGEHFDKRIGSMVPNKRSSKLSTKEFSEYMEWLVRFAATELGGIMVPLPGESEAA